MSSTTGGRDATWIDGLRPYVEKAPLAAEAMGVTSAKLQQLGIVDETIAEPLGGAHRDIDAMAEKLKLRLSAQVDELSALPVDQLLEKRYQRLMSFGNL